MIVQDMGVKSFCVASAPSWLKREGAEIIDDWASPKGC